LDSRVQVKYGEWVKSVFEAKELISLDSTAYFKLKSDYAKSFWPFIESQPNYSYVGVETLAELGGRDYLSETTRQRLKFREEVRQAFDDMVNAGGLATWRCEEVGSGRAKSYRYHYTHALPRQAELGLLIANERPLVEPAEN